MLLLTPVISYALGVYLTHMLFTEFYFDHPFLRYAFSKSHHPLIKPNKAKLILSRILFFIGGFVLIACLIFIPPFLWLFPLAPLTVYLQICALLSVRSQIVKGTVFFRESQLRDSELFVLDGTPRQSFK